MGAKELPKRQIVVVPHMGGHTYSKPIQTVLSTLRETLAEVCRLEIYVLLHRGTSQTNIDPELKKFRAYDSCDDLAQLYNTLRLSDTYLIGYSLGGFIVANFLSQHRSSAPLRVAHSLLAFVEENPVLSLDRLSNER